MAGDANAGFQRRNTLNCHPTSKVSRSTVLNVSPGRGLTRRVACTRRAPPLFLLLFLYHSLYNLCLYSRRQRHVPVHTCISE